MFAVSCPAFSGLVCGGLSSKQWCSTASAKFSQFKLFHLICHPVVGICTLQMFRKFWGADVLIRGLRMGPQSLQKFAQP